MSCETTNLSSHTTLCHIKILHITCTKDCYASKTETCIQFTFKWVRLASGKYDLPLQLLH
jgi:hypothetical protein